MLYNILCEERGRFLKKKYEQEIRIENQSWVVFEIANYKGKKF